jgi:hypothetical protein
VQTGEFDQYSSGTRHLISPPVATTLGLTAANTTNLTNRVFSSIPQGKDFFPEGAFLRNDQTKQIEQYSGGEGHFVSIPVGTKLGLGAAQVITISATQYNAITLGNDYFPEGMLIQNVQTNEVDIYSGGERHWISVPVMTRMNLTTSQATTISASQFNQIPQGKDYFPDGVYLQNQDTGEISQYSGGVNHMVSAPVVSAMGLTATQWISVTSAQYNAITKGSDYFPDGMFLQDDQTREIDQYSGGQLHWVSSLEALAAGLTPAQVVTIGDDQFSAIPRGSDFVAPPIAQTSTSGNSNS